MSFEKQNSPDGCILSWETWLQLSQFSVSCNLRCWTAVQCSYNAEWAYFETGLLQLFCPRGPCSVTRIWSVLSSWWSMRTGNNFWSEAGQSSHISPLLFVSYLSFVLCAILIIVWYLPLFCVTCSRLCDISILFLNVTCSRLCHILPMFCVTCSRLCDIFPMFCVTWSRLCDIVPMFCVHFHGCVPFSRLCDIFSCCLLLCLL